MKLTAHYFESMDAFFDACNQKPKDVEYCLYVASKCVIDHAYLSKQYVKVIGAIFREIIFNNRVYDDGLIAIEVDQNKQLHLICNIKNPSLEIYDFSDVKSIITIFDGMSPYSEKFLQTLFSYTNIDTKIIGGGAGLLYKDESRIFFDNNQFYRNCALLLTMSFDINLAVQHGWEYLEGPFVVTSSQESLLKGIDYQNAFDIYKRVVEKDAKVQLTQENFLSISKMYPLGIVKYRGEQIVRDPIKFDENGLTLIGNIDNNTVINILRGNKRTLLDATKNASKEVVSDSSECAIIFDCITRKDFLEDEFDKELDIIYKQKESMNVIGAITIGEVANDGKSYINFLNKTCVIGGVCF